MPAAADLIKLLKSSNPDERATAAQALGRVLIDPARHWRGTPRASERDPFADQRRAQQRLAVAALVPLIKDDDEQVRSAVAVALSYVGCEAEPALRELEQLAKHNQTARFAVNDLKRVLEQQRTRTAKPSAQLRP
ncbi:MAG: HEAT repeat domain-containing protein [Pirellulales bacterium]